MVRAWTASLRSGSNWRLMTRENTMNISSRPRMTMATTMRCWRWKAPKISFSGQTIPTLQPVVMRGL